MLFSVTISAHGTSRGVGTVSATSRENAARILKLDAHGRCLGAIVALEATHIGGPELDSTSLVGEVKGFLDELEA